MTVAFAATDGHVPIRFGATGSAHFERKISLGAISAAELRLDTPALNMGKYGGLPAGKALTRPIVREVSDVWQIAVDKSVSPFDFDVEYFVEAADGSRNRLTSEHDGSSALRVRVEPMSVATHKSANDNEHVVSGSVRLFIYLDDVRHAGAYQGTLRAIIEKR